MRSCCICFRDTRVRIGYIKTNNISPVGVQFQGKTSGQLGVIVIAWREESVTPC